MAATIAGEWFVHHPRQWIDERKAAWPRFATETLLWIGTPAAEITDAFALTGKDAVVRLARKPPAGSVVFAGLPSRTGAPAPGDIEIINKGEFIIGWSPSLKHPVWCAYHVPKEAPYPSTQRPPFHQDRSARNSPLAGDYSRSGYDRGHMVPNYATVTRFGPDVQKKTFLMSNITPQTPSLNRGVWREVEYRIAEFWPGRWGEMWIVVGSISRSYGSIRPADIDVPDAYYQLIVAQSGDEVRAVAVMFPQNVAMRAWPSRYILSIDELEAATGLDFLTALDDETEDELERQVPTRMLPTRPLDALRLVISHNS